MDVLQQLQELGCNVMDAHIGFEDGTRVLTLFVRVDDTPGRVETVMLALPGYDRAASDALAGSASTSPAAARKSRPAERYPPPA